MSAPRFVGLPSPTQPRAGAGGHPCQGLYWTGDNPRPRIAVIANHYNVDFAEHYIAPYFAARGIGFLGWNTRYRGNEDLFILEQALVDIGVGVRWLREEAGAEVIVLVGNSGGGSLMAAWQAEAVSGSLAAEAELARLNAAGIPDRIFPLFRAWADLRFMDPAIDPSDRPCPGSYAGPPHLANCGPLGLGRANTLRSWLSMWSLETSKCQGVPQLAHVTVPALVVQSTADMGVFPSDARAVFEAIAAPDKTLEMIPGAHYFEGPPEHREFVADLMAAWIAART